MSLSPFKQEMLETLFLNDKPMKPADVAKETGREFEAAKMQLLGLARMKYVNFPEKGLCVITQKGKEALGIPQTSKEKATAILNSYQTPMNALINADDWLKAVDGLGPVITSKVKEVLSTPYKAKPCEDSGV